MISICIPIYNLAVSELVMTLLAQKKKLSVPCQLILIDDGSDDTFKQQNEALKTQVDAFLSLKKNIGRAAVRNQFLTLANHEYLLYLDCDSSIIHDDFLEQYCTQITRNQPFVLCGGNDYPAQISSSNFLLRWTYSHAKESRIARSQTENLSFMTNNFLIKKSILAAIPFDESLTQYGHEDTLLGYELKKKQIPILHFDNPVMNDVADSNAIFIEKTERGLENLTRICKKLHYEKGFIEEVKILKVYFFLKKVHLTPCLTVFYFLFQKLLKNLFSKGMLSNLFLFDAYKLAFLHQKFGSLNFFVELQGQI